MPLRCCRFVSRQVLGICLLTTALGCGSKAPPPIPSSIVSGIVRLDGNPVVGAQVTFVPTGNTRGFGGMAVTNSQGQFLIDRSGGPGATGLPEGSYKVLVESFRPPEDPTLAAQFKMPDLAPTKIPPLYGQLDRSPLDAIVAISGPPLEFELRSKR